MTKTFNEYLEDTSKDELCTIVDNYNKFATIYGEDILSIKGLKKEKLVELLKDSKNKYIKYILSIVNLEDCNNINNGTIHDELKKYLSKYNMLDNEGNIYSDIKKDITKLLKDKNIIDSIKKWDNINNIINGLIIAYGVVDINYVKDIITKYCDYDETTALLKIRPKSYNIEKKRIVSKLLTSRKRIDKYFNDSNYKEFSIKELKELGTNKYHYNIKEFKKLVAILKNHYVFKRKDIKFIDENVIIPYLYTSINEEDNAKNELLNRLEEFFEFRRDKLKKSICEQIEGIRNNFPLWEYRGFNKNEVKK